MKIVHISTNISGGAGIAALRLHQGLLDQGIHSSFLYLNGRSGQTDRNLFKHPIYYPRFFHRFFKKFGIPLNASYKAELRNARMTKTASFELFSWISTDYRVHEHVCVKEADIIVLHWINSFVDISTFFKKLGNKSVFWYLHDLNPILGGFHLTKDMEANKALSKVNDRLIREKRKIYEKQPISIIGNSKWTCSRAQKSGMFPLETHYKTIHLGVNLNEFYPIDKKLAKKALGLQEDFSYILFGATDINRKWKGFSIFIDAISQLEKNEKFIHTRVITIGSAQEVLNEVIMFGNVRHLELLRLIYSAADLFVSTSLDESLGLTLIEAMACGTPCIAFNVGGISEVVEDMHSGVLLDDLSSTSVARAINDFSNFDRKQFSINARKTVVDKFNLNDQVSHFLSFLGEE